jgi:hypothetical protein
MACGVASFLRLCQVNVDVSGKVGPLLDPDLAYHKGESQLSNYNSIFGPLASNAQLYMPKLGVEVQRSPTTHPIRSYDPNRLFLMKGNGGGRQRANRKGLSFMNAHLDSTVDMLFQCFLVEVVRLPVLVEWSTFKERDLAQKVTTLPVVADIDSFLHFVGDILSHNNFCLSRNVLQTQYELHDAFNYMSGFSRVVAYVARGCRVWVCNTISLVTNTPSGDDTDVFGNCISSLAAFMSDSQGLGTPGDKPLFFCQHILMNLNELVAGWPFGKPQVAIMGFGGTFGARRLARGVGNQYTTQEVLALQLETTKTSDSNELAMIGVEKADDGTITISQNERTLCILEPEHWGCLDYTVIERAPGGSRGLGIRYEVSFPHCHPIRHVEFSLSIATVTVKSYIAAVDSGKWQMQEIITHPLPTGSTEDEEDGFGIFEEDSEIED